MITFSLSVVALILGYFIYGRVVEKIFGINQKAPTPAFLKKDNIDYIPMNWKKSYLIQFLNIAGTGPIFGAIMGAYWGPVAYIWIVFGCIFAGTVHDYLSGMLSVRHNGTSAAEIVGIYLGKYAKIITRFVSILVLILVGVIFITTPKDILANMFSGINGNIWFFVIVGYYIFATILPINKIIGRIYPIFGASLLIMGVGLVVTMFTKGYFTKIPELTLQNLHPGGKAIFPFLCITIACGAISGFHSTQAPLMARCLQNEGDGRRVFYGAMITEGIIALIWATVAMTFYESTESLAAAGTPGVVVSQISSGLMGTLGGVLATLGVVACPITSGDTAFRSVRLIISDALNFDQKPLKNRFIIAIPLFALAVLCCFIEFSALWRYTSWTNQILAAFVLWASARYLYKSKKFHWIASLPATFMTVVVVSYILIADEGLKLNFTLGMIIAVFIAIICLICFLIVKPKVTKIS